MANTGIRQLTTVVGGYAKRIWYSLNGTTPTNELMSIDDAGKFKSVSQQITGLAGTENRMVVADSAGNLSANGTIYKHVAQQSFNYIAFYGINYINSAVGGQVIVMPLAIIGAEIEILNKTLGANTFLGVTGANKIYDLAGNDVTSTYTATSSLATVRRIRFIGTRQIDRSGTSLNSGAVDWLVVEQVNA